MKLYTASVLVLSGIALIHAAPIRLRETKLTVGTPLEERVAAVKLPDSGDATPVGKLQSRTISGELMDLSGDASHASTDLSSTDLTLDTFNRAGRGSEFELIPPRNKELLSSASSKKLAVPSPRASTSKTPKHISTYDLFDEHDLARLTRDHKLTRPEDHPRYIREWNQQSWYRMQRQESERLAAQVLGSENTATTSASSVVGSTVAASRASTRKRKPKMISETPSSVRKARVEVTGVSNKSKRNVQAQGQSKIKARKKQSTPVPQESSYGSTRPTSQA